MTNISEMTNEQLNEALAIEVKGWERVSYHGEWWWRETKGGHSWRPYLVSDWQPCTDLNQAVECAEKLRGMGYLIEVSMPKINQYGCCVHIHSDGREFEYNHWYYDGLHARALCEAVLMAVRGEDK